MNQSHAIRALQQENNRLKDENRAFSEQLSHLRGAIRALNLMEKSLSEIDNETDIFALINHILSSALQAVDSDNGSLLLLDEETNELVFVEVTGPQSDQLVGYRMPADQGIVGATISSRTPMLVPDVRKDPQWFSQIDESIGFETLSIMCVPVMDGDRPLGAIEIVNKRSDAPFDRADLDILLLIARLAALAMVKAEKITQQMESG